MMNEFKRMQKLAGIITESQLNEDMALSSQELKAKSETTGKSIMDIYNLLSEIDDMDDVQEIGFVISNKDWSNRDEFSTKQKIYKEIQKHIDDKAMVSDLNKLHDGVMNNESQLNEEVYGGQSVDRGETGSSIEFEIKENTPEYYTIDYTITPNSKYSSRSAARNYVRTKKSGTARIKKDYNAPSEWITVEGDSFLVGKQFEKEIFGDKAD